MRHEEHNDIGDSLNEIWRNAERRRTDEIRSLLMRFFETRRQMKSVQSRIQHVPSRVTSWMWKILDAARAA
jgi:hypothetical protein